MLPLTDTEYLRDRVPRHEVSTEANMTCVVIRDFALPAGFDHEKSDLLIRLNAGYPDVRPDMWWFDPPAKRADGQAIPATEVIEHHIGRSWQRWSRHLTPEQWKSGIDCLEGFVAIIRGDIERAAPVPVP